MKVLVAGPSGFVGKRLCPVLAAAGHHVIAMTRTRSATPGELVRATGLGKATVYRLDPTEDALVAAYLRRLAATIGAAIGEEITAHEGDPGAALLAILDAIEADLSRSGFRGCPCNNASIEFDDPQHPARAEARAYREQRRERGAGEVVATTASRSRNDHMSRGLAAASHPGSGS